MLEIVVTGLLCNDLKCNKTEFSNAKMVRMYPIHLYRRVHDFCFSWYHGSISRIEAQDRLLQVNSSGQYLQTDGAFLVRASETSPGDFSLSVK